MSQDQLKLLQDCCCICDKKKEDRHVLNKLVIHLIKEVLNIEINEMFDQRICNDCQTFIAHIHNAKSIRQAAIQLYESSENVAGTSAETSRDKANRDTLRHRLSPRSRSRSRSLFTPPTPGEGLASSNPSSYKESNTDNSTE